MYSKMLLVFAVCVKIVFSDDSPEPEVDDLIYIINSCCDYNETYADFLQDPCYKDAAEGEITTIECLIECVYTQNNLMVDDKVDQENMKNYLEIIINEEHRSRFMEAAETCDKLGKEYVIENFGHLQKTDQCDSYYVVFDSCVMLNAVTRCPEQYMDKSDFCASQLVFLKEFVFNKE